MTRWAAIIGAGLLAALVAVVLLRPAPPATDADRAEALAAGLRCPDCAGLSVADSQSTSAVAIRHQIDDLIATGAPDAEIRRHFTDRYGDWVLLAPTAAAAWILPFAVVLAAVAGLGAWLLSRRRPGSTPAPIDEAERRRLHDEVEALDA